MVDVEGGRVAPVSEWVGKLDGAKAVDHIRRRVRSTDYGVQSIVAIAVKSRVGISSPLIR